MHLEEGHGDLKIAQNLLPRSLPAQANSTMNESPLTSAKHEKEFEGKGGKKKEKQRKITKNKFQVKFKSNPASFRPIVIILLSYGLFLVTSIILLTY